MFLVGVCPTMIGQGDIARRMPIRFGGYAGAVICGYVVIEGVKCRD
jgi:hypothetical protein